jgi:hypothetical protein
MEDQKLLLIQKETGCDLAFGKLILKFTGGDLEGAIKIIKSVDKNIFIIRGKFVAQVERIYGAFIFLFDSKTRAIDKFNTIIKKDDKSAIEFDFETSWSSFLKDITNYSHKNIIEVEMQNRFSNTIRSGKVLQFFDSKLSTKKDIDEKAMNIFFKDILLNITGDLNVVVKLKIEKSDAFEINKGSIQEPEFDFDKEVKEEKKEKIQEEDTSHIIVLKVEFELSPLEGMRLSELKSGELINVKIVEDSPISSYISNLLKGRNVDRLDKEIYIAELKELKVMDDGGISIMVEFGPGIYGRAYYGEDVKIRTSTKQDSVPDKKFVKENFLFKNIWVIAATFICILIIILLLFLNK